METIIRSRDVNLFMKNLGIEDPGNPCGSLDGNQIDNLKALLSETLSKLTKAMKSSSEGSIKSKVDTSTTLYCEDDAQLLEPRGRCKVAFSEERIFVQGKAISLDCSWKNVSHVMKVPHFATSKKDGEDIVAVYFKEPVKNEINSKELKCFLWVNQRTPAAAAMCTTLEKLWKHEITTTNPKLFLSITKDQKNVHKHFLRCYSGTQEGALYPLECGIAFMKPLKFIPNEEISSVSAGRGGASGNTRYVDLQIETLDDRTIEFTNIDRDELVSLQNYVKGFLEARARKLATKKEKKEKAQSTGVDVDEESEDDDSDEDDDDFDPEADDSDEEDNGSENKVKNSRRQKDGDAGCGENSMTGDNSDDDGDDDDDDDDDENDDDDDDDDDDEDDEEDDESFASESSIGSDDGDVEDPEEQLKKMYAKKDAKKVAKTSKATQSIDPKVKQEVPADPVAAVAAVTAVAPMEESREDDSESVNGKSSGDANASECKFSSRVLSSFSQPSFIVGDQDEGNDSEKKAKECEIAHKENLDEANTSSGTKRSLAPQSSDTNEKDIPSAEKKPKIEAKTDSKGQSSMSNWLTATKK